jgi:hypothetical protein
MILALAFFLYCGALIGAFVAGLVFTGLMAWGRA